MIQSLSILSPLQHVLHGCSAVLQVVAVEIVMLQRQSRERARLAEMDQLALKDVGLTRLDIATELDKPVWKR